MDGAEFLSVKEAAELLGVKPSFVYERTRPAGVGRDGFPAPYRFGPGTVRFKRADLLRWAEGRRLRPAPLTTGARPA